MPDTRQIIPVPEKLPPARQSDLGSGPDSASEHDEHQIPLVSRVTCPHCWHAFKPEEILWVAQHEDLIGDLILKEEALRFLPTRFNLEGQAIDARGMVCTTLACPHCHLVIPRPLLENELTIFSLIGSVGSGKSNFLAAMTWQLRQQLASQFAITFADGDKEANWILNRNEELLFLPEDPDRPIAIEKTRAQGDLYRSVRIDGQETQLPKPFLFSLHPAIHHPNSARRLELGKIVGLYDNAGEHYGVGQDTPLTPVTKHLAKAKVVMFLFDPTQDPRFRDRCRGISSDPQVAEAMQTVRQETILAEAAGRIRRHCGLTAHQRYPKPLLVLVAKSDIWGPLLKEDITHEPILPGAGTLPATVDVERVERVSLELRTLLLNVAPEFVAVAEDFWNQVIYIPTSALGHSPRKDPERQGLYVCPREVKPHWVTIPVLYAYARWSVGLIGGSRNNQSPWAKKK